MKVYELMKQLADMPAGDEVKISMTITTEEFANGHQADDDLTFMEFDISEVNKDSKAIYISA